VFRFGFGLRSAMFAHASAAIFRSVAVQQFAPVATCRNAYTIATRVIGVKLQTMSTVSFADSLLRNNENRAGEVVVAVHPLEARGTGVRARAKRARCAVNAVRCPTQFCSAVGLILQHMPLQAGVMRPLAHLPKLVAHEQHFFPG